MPPSTCRDSATPMVALELIAPDASVFLARPDRRVGPGSAPRRRPRCWHGRALFLAVAAGARHEPDRRRVVRFPTEVAAALKVIIEALSPDVGARAGTPGHHHRPARSSWWSGAERAACSRGLRQRLRPRALLRLARFVRDYPAQNPVLRDLLPTITTPTQIVAGRDDDLVPWSNNQYVADLEQRAPPARRGPLRVGASRRGHACRVPRHWVSGGYRRVAAG